MVRRKLAVVLGIRPDVIRASIILEILRSKKRSQIVFIWSGQHYSENLKDIFFRQLRVKQPDVELNARGKTDSGIVSSIIRKLYPVLEELQPVAAVFLGDTNTVMGCVAAAQLNIPIVHIEGCMRSYDWRMPEEKYRIITDHLSDVIYAYLQEYKGQGVAEGLNPNNIIVTGNPIVDVLDRYFTQRKKYFEKKADEQFFLSRRISKQQFYLMTCHRRENVEDIRSLKNIIDLAAFAACPVYFPASYRTQRALKASSIKLPENVIMVDPVGYEQFLLLMSNSRAVLSDSGTVVEESCILHVPSVQMRRSTERPQLYDVGACVKFDPTCPEKPETVFAKLALLRTRTWRNPLGDGKASQRISADILRRLEKNEFARHKPTEYHLEIEHSFRDDGLERFLE